MNEDTLLEGILALAETGGYAAAYAALSEKLPEFPGEPSPQVLYFLACLAGGGGRADMAVQWLKDAIDARGYWYRPEMLDDGDLSCLAENADFIRLKALSDKRCKAAQESAKPLFTWKEKTADKLLIAVHGNGQNAKIAKEPWAQLSSPALQIEAVQSSIVDSYERFRWNYDEENYYDFVAAARKIERAGYEKLIFAGFSAGCDILLRTLLREEIRCDVLLLQSPWIPIIDTDLEKVAKMLADKGIETRIFCGEFGEDCAPMAERLFYAAAQVWANACLHRQHGLRHEFPAVLGAEYRGL